MNLAEIKEKKRTGDINTAAAMVDISAPNASAAFKRTKSKHHAAICQALSKIISTREQLTSKSQ